MEATKVGVVLIGRNEGERLRSCLASAGTAHWKVYVDSGSDDGSQALAHSMGFDVVDLDTSLGFTAARARNAGFKRLLEVQDDVEFVQFIDGDCELRADWLASALADMEAQPELAGVFGRRRERFPDKNIYHRSCDVEWAVPPGEVASCGGDVLFRTRALMQVGGYNPDLIAGEEPDLCHRLRQEGWRILSNGREMTWHDVAITSLSQWWRRTKRAGYAFAELIDRYRGSAESSWTRLVGSALAWSAVLAGTLLSFLAYLVTGSPMLLGLAALLALAVVGRIGLTAWNARRNFDNFGVALRWSALLFVSKLAQTEGAMLYLWRRRRRRKPQLIEYK